MQKNTSTQPFQSAQSFDLTQLIDLMKRVKDPVVARVLIAHMNEQTRLRDQYPGAYLMATETVKRDHIRYAKAHRWGRLAAIAGQGTAKATLAALATLRSCTSWSLSQVKSLYARMRAARRAAQPRIASKASNVVNLPVIVESNESMAYRSSANVRQG